MYLPQMPQKLIHAPRGLQKNTSSAQRMSAKDPVTYATVQSAEKKQSQPQRKSSSHHELKSFAETKTKTKTSTTNVTLRPDNIHQKNGL